MEWIINSLIRLMGAFLTSYGVLMTQKTPLEPGWVIGLLTVGLTLLFLPEVKK